MLQDIVDANAIARDDEQVLGRPRQDRHRTHGFDERVQGAGLHDIHVEEPLERRTIGLAAGHDEQAWTRPECREAFGDLQAIGVERAVEHRDVEPGCARNGLRLILQRNPMHHITLREQGIDVERAGVAMLRYDEHGDSPPSRHRAK